MRTRSILFSALLPAAFLGGAGIVRADGAAEIYRGMLPLTISQPGSYRAVDNLEYSGTPPVALIAAGSAWRYLDDGSDQGTNWVSPGFNDSAWASGPARLGYGGDGEVTTLSYGPDSNNKYITYYFRQPFVVPDPSIFIDLDLFLLRDDGAVVYLNGEEVARDNMPSGTVTYTTFAVAPVTSSSGDEQRFFEFDVDQTLLVPGTNVLAVEIHQVNLTSSDLGFDLYLNGDTAASSTLTNGITITADDVYLDLNGRVLRGAYGSTLDGIRIVPGVKNAVIENGAITGWGEDGVDAGFSANTATGCVFRALTLSDNFIEGLQGGANALVDQCASFHNGWPNNDPGHEEGSGILVGRSSLVRRSVAARNFAHGIVLRSSSEATDCIAYHNNHDGVKGGAGSLFTRCIAMEEQINGDGIEVDGGSVVSECSSYNNHDDGIKTRNFAYSVLTGCTSAGNYSDGLNTKVNGSILIDNVAAGNRDDGISVHSRSLVAENLCYNNGFVSGDGAGVTIKANQGKHNRIVNNHTPGNRDGIAVLGSNAKNNLLIGNSAVANLTNYPITSVSNNLVGAVTNAPAAAVPWANFSF